MGLAHIGICFACATSFNQTLVFGILLLQYVSNDAAVFNNNWELKCYKIQDMFNPKHCFIKTLASSNVDICLTMKYLIKTYLNWDVSNVTNTEDNQINSFNQDLGYG